jgi:hypothetical protein
LSYSQVFESISISTQKSNGKGWSVRKAPGRPRADGSAGRAARVQLGGDEGSFDMMEQIEVQKISYSKVQVFVSTRQQFRN